MRLWICGLALSLMALGGAYSPASAGAAQAIAFKPSIGETTVVEQARRRWPHRHLFRFGYGYPFYGLSFHVGPRYRYRHWGHRNYYRSYGYYGHRPRWNSYRSYW